jgi:phosphatidylglycerol:prolipoprotein diacylglycerol transferase
LAGWSAYALFYLLGFGLAGGRLLAEGWRRGFPMRPWLLLVAGTVLALIAGTRLIAGGPADWLALVSQGHWGSGEVVGRSVLGGMVAAALAVAGLRRLLGFGREAADAFALPFVLGLAVQGVGCLLTGCCFGEMLHNGPGIGLTYGPGTAPFVAQVAQGLLPATAGHSLPIHAAPLYQMLLCLGIAGVLLGLRRTLAKRPGLALPLAFGLYAAGRFGLEFWRDPLGDVVGAGFYYSLKPVQWGLLAATTGLGAAAARRWRQPAASASVPTDQSALNLVVVLLLLLLPPVLPGCFDLGETLVLRAVLLPVLGLEAGRLLRVIRVTKPLPVVLLVLSLGLMSQTPAPAPSATGEKPGPSLTVGLGGLTGSSYQLYEQPSSGCGAPTQNITSFPGYHQRFSGITASAAYELPVGQTRQNAFIFGLNGFLGRTSFDPPAARIGVLSDSLVVLEQADSRFLYDINPSVEFFKPGTPGHSLRLRWGMGVHLSRRYAYDYVTIPLRSREIVPSFVFEIGYRNQLWLHTSVFQGADAVGNGTARFGLGSGFGNDKLTLLGGLAYTNSNGQLDTNIISFGNPVYRAPTAGFLDLRWQLTPSWQLEGSGMSNFNDASRLTLGARYRLPLGRKAP